MPNDEEIPGYGYTGIDPTDLALFGGLRASLPLSALLYSKELNSGPEAERFARQKAYEMAMAERQQNAQVQRAIEIRRQQELDARIPPEVQRFYINSRYDPATATRRADYETPPMRNFGSPGSEMRAAPRRFQKGGSAKKTLQQMMDELLVRGTKTATKDTPDIGRRALFGLRPQLDLPLAKIHPDIEKATESRITKALSPGKPGEPYISEEFAASLKAKGKWTPRDEKVFGPQLSRRALLTGAAGQAVRRMIPGLDSLVPSASDVVPELKGALQTVAGPNSTLSISEILPGLIAKHIKPTKSGHWSGVDEGAVIKELGERGYSDPSQYKGLLNDYNFVDPESGMDWASLGALKRPFEHYQSIIDPRGEIAGRIGFDQSRNPLSYRPAMRQMREANPDLYKETLDSARQLTNNDVETVLENMRYGEKSRKAKDVYKSLDEWRKNKMSAQDLENKFPDFVDE